MFSDVHPPGRTEAFVDQLYLWLIGGSALLLSGLVLSGQVLPNWLQVMALTIGVALLGLPHGAMDYYVARERLASHLGSYWGILFLSFYTIWMGLVFLGWWYVPITTMVLFFLLSARHFGHGDVLLGERTPPWQARVQPWVSGLMVIGFPTLLHGRWYHEILEIIFPSSNRQLPAGWIETAQIVTLSLLLPSWLVLLSRSARPEAFRLFSFGLLLLVVPPLLSFGFYFCFWHSWRALRHWMHQQPPGARSVCIFLSRSWFFAALTVLLAGVAGWAWQSDLTLSDALIQNVFLTLSMVAVPHMLLEDGFRHLEMREVAHAI